MNSFSTVVLALALLFATASTSALEKPLSIKFRTIKVPMTLQNPSARLSAETAYYAISSSSVGYANVASVGIKATRGTYGQLNYYMRARAVKSTYFAQYDNEFERILSKSDASQFASRRSSYSGGLNVSLFYLLNLNLNKYTSADDVASAYQSESYYQTKSKYVQNVVDQAEETDIEISGSLLATGYSFIPTQVTAFLRTAEVTKRDGSTLTVVSTSANDVVAATTTGNVVPYKEGKLNIVSL